jgi:hypothetical protein
MFPRLQNLSDDDRCLPEPSRKFLSWAPHQKSKTNPKPGTETLRPQRSKAPLTRSEGHSERLEKMFSSEQWLPLHKAVWKWEQRHLQ